MKPLIPKIRNADGTQQLSLNSDGATTCGNPSPETRKVGFIGPLCSVFLILVLL